MRYGSALTQRTSPPFALGVVVRRAQDADRLRLVVVVEVVVVDRAERAFAVHPRLLAQLADQRDSGVAEVLEGVQHYAEEVRS